MRHHKPGWPAGFLIREVAVCFTIVLDANPLDDITNTRKISQVILRGAAVDRSKMPN